MTRPSKPTKNTRKQYSEEYRKDALVVHAENKVT